MKKNKKITKGIINELEIWGRMFLEPERIISDLREKDKISYAMVMRVLAIHLFLILIMPFSVKSLIRGMIGTVISITLLCLYLAMIVIWSKGKVTVKHVINLSLYSHLSYIMLNKLTVHGRVGVILFVILHLVALKIQMVGLKGLFNCQKKRLMIIFYIEGAVLLWRWLDLILGQVGREMMFNEEVILQYPLIGARLV